MALSEGDKIISEIHRKTALVDHINLIPVFNGDPGSVSYGDFKRSFDRLSGLYGWEEKEKIFVLFTRVTGSAAQLLKTYEKDANNFHQLIDILAKRYDKRDSPAVALQKFMNFKQSPGMSVQEFFDRATHLSLSALVVDGADENLINKTRTEMLKSMLLNNLSPEIKKGVVAKDPKDPQEILKFALLEEKSWEAVRADAVSHATLTFPSSSGNEQVGNHFVCAAAHTQNSEKSQLEELKEQVKLLTAQVANLVAIKGQEQEGTVKNLCFRCGQPGHYARSCGDFGNQRGNWDNSRNFTNRGGHQNQRGNWDNDRTFTNRGGHQYQRGSSHGRGYNSNDRGGSRGGFRSNRGYHNGNRNDRETPAGNDQQSGNRHDTNTRNESAVSLNE